MDLGPDYWLPNGLARHTAKRPGKLISVDSVLDVGAGVRPMQWYKPARHVCLEPYGPYADRLEAAGYEVRRRTAQEGLEDADGIYLLDVIEHMEKDAALAVIEEAKARARVQVVIYTPLGFMEQNEDNWGLGGHEWQTHRSGWLYPDLPGFDFERFGRGFFATWHPSTPR